MLSSRRGWRKSPPCPESTHPRIKLSSLDKRGLEASLATEDCRDEIKHSFAAGEMRPSENG